MAEAAREGEPAAMLAAFSAVAGGDVQTACEVLWSSVGAVMPMVSVGMSDARKVNALRALAARLLAEADAIHRPEG